MTITFEKEELVEFQRKLAEWHQKQTIFVLENMSGVVNYSDPLRRHGPDMVRALMEKFEKENPRPDWRSLL